MKEWLKDILLQILLQRKFWMHDIGGLKIKSLAKLVTTFPKKPFL
jgi:hypothetical protein